MNILIYKYLFIKVEFKHYLKLTCVYMCAYNNVIVMTITITAVIGCIILYG